jgi:putative transposase
MPWRTLNMIDARQEFVLKAQRKAVPLAALCREFGISRKTAYKWLKRAAEEGLFLLADRSRRPYRSATQLEEEAVCRLVRLKLAHPRWGPKKIRVLYARQFGSAPSLSTCHRVLKRSGLVETVRRRKVDPAARLQTGIVAAAPNDVWTVDFKGWWRLADQQRCEPLTVRDAYSRFVLAVEVTPSAKTEVIRAVFQRLFERYGLPRVIKSDNGVPFASTQALLGLTRLSAWWVALGIQLDRSRPAHPQDNGAHERMHRDIKAEIASHIQPDREAQQAACELWREEFNCMRPHETLAQRTPAQLYQKSPRRYQPASLTYPAGFITRRVNRVGIIIFQQQSLFICAALAGWDLGLHQTSASCVEVWFAHLLLGHINLQTLGFFGTPSRPEEAQRLSA